VISAAGLFDADSAVESEYLPRPTQILWPQQKFLDAAQSAALANLSTDRSGVPRSPTRWSKGYAIDQISYDIGMPRQMVDHYMRLKDQMGSPPRAGSVSGC
jgi:hypothetical protein